MLEEEFYQELGRRIRRWRRLRDITQDEMAEYLGIAQPSYCRVEAGRRQLQVHELYLLSKRLSVGVDVLVPHEKLSRQ